MTSDAEPKWLPSTSPTRACLEKPKPPTGALASTYVVAIGRDDPPDVCLEPFAAETQCLRHVPFHL
jgi:hypothetical protein